MRKLASIRKIKALTPIPDADRIEVATVDGWKVVVQKGLHRVGDLIVFFEVDSLLPERPEFEFLRKSSYVTEKNSVNGPGFRLKTIKLKKQISQGLIIPIRELPEFFFQIDDLPDRWFYQPLENLVTTTFGDIELSAQSVEEGLDVTDLLGVKKWERPIPANLAGKIKGNFPSFVPKTDQERIQNFINDFMVSYRDHTWEVSLKLDGSSLTVFFLASEDKFGVCSRNLELSETEDNAYWKITRNLDLEKKMRNFGRSIAIQGEMMGPGIQNNMEKFNDLKFYVFDIFDISEGRYLSSSERREITNLLELDHVPIYEMAKMGYDSVDGFLELAEYGYDGKSIYSNIREGLVFKSVDDPSVSFKAINPKFLLEED